MSRRDNMIRWVLQVFAIGLAVYVSYANRYRLLNLILANGMIRKFLVTRSLNIPFVRDRMMGTVFNRNFK